MLSTPETTGGEEGSADDPDPAPEGPEEVLLTSPWERRGQPHSPCFTGWLTEACLSVVPGTALEVEEGLDIFNMNSDDDAEEGNDNKDDEGKRRTIWIECKVWAILNRAVILFYFPFDKVGRGDGGMTWTSLS